MNRSVTVTTHGGALTLGNWDEVGSRKAAVSWGVAPNVDSITFYPITDGNVIDSVSGVTVSGEGVSADGKASLKVGETLSLNASVTPDSVADKTVQWTSSDEQVATVDEHGVVKGVKAGTVTITATSVADSSRSGSVEVTVAEDSEQKPRAATVTTTASRPASQMETPAVRPLIPMRAPTLAITRSICRSPVLPWQLCRCCRAAGWRGAAAQEAAQP